MKIIQLMAENIKRIKAIDITPTDDCIIISGKTENGKSSVLDAIWLALQYKAASKDNPVPLRAGEDKGYVTVDLGDYIVTRKFTEKDSYLEIRTPEGSKITSPQKLLDGLIGELSFDPYAFLTLSEADQKQTLGDLLFKITNGKVDLAAFEQRYQKAYEQRTELNRDHKRLSALITGFRPPCDTDPKTEVSSLDVLNDIRAASEHNSIRDSIESRNKQIKKLQDENDAALNGVPSLIKEDITPLQAKLTSIEATNKRAREVIQYGKLLEELAVLSATLDRTNSELELIQIEKDEAIENSPLPVEGLIIDAEGVKITTEEGELVPLKQASTARGLKISLAIAMAANPTLRVIRISNGSVLDDDCLNLIKDMAKDNDYQLWVEFTSRNSKDRIGVYIEDGMVIPTETVGIV